MGKQYIFRPSSTTPPEVLDFLEQATKETSFPKLLVSLVEKELARQNGEPQPTAQSATGFDFSPAAASASFDDQSTRIFEKLDEIEQKVDKVANIGLKVDGKVAAVDSHLFSSMKVIDSKLKAQTASIEKLSDVNPWPADAESVFADMPDRMLFTEMASPVKTTASEKSDTDELLRTLLEA